MKPFHLFRTKETVELFCSEKGLGFPQEQRRNQGGGYPFELRCPWTPAHIVLESIGFMPSFESDRLELIYPVPSGPISIGENPALWESGKISYNGKYLWVYWRRRICCIY